MEAALSVALGIGLAAACGFRVFVPLLVVSIASLAGWLPLAGGFEWIATIPALIAFATATVIEVAAYYVTWLDHVLDVVASPAAVLCGVIAAASVITDLPPVVRWSVAIIGGGGAAGLVQGATVLVRLKSAALTGGLANPLVATAELFGSAMTSLLALLMPLAAVLLIALLCIAVFAMSGRFLFGRPSEPPPSP